MAAAPKKAIDWRVFIWAGAADVAIGIGLAVAALTGVLGDTDVNVLAGVGGLLALVGVGIFLWGRNNLENRRGDIS